MLKNYTPSEWKEETYYELVFDDGRGNGLCFPCDEAGNILPAPEHPSIDHNAVDEARRRNRDSAMEHPEKYVRFNKVIKQTHSYREPAYGLCECGAEFPMFNEYMGACECPGCGQWYNLFGQELLPPERWEEGDDW